MNENKDGNEIEIEADGNISSIIETIKNNLFSYGSSEIWFRGQSDYSYKLEPTVFRAETQENGYRLFYDEARIYYEFIRRYPEHSENHKSVFEWLTLMQHYRLPTRLLDWSTNLLVALFFCCNQKQNEKDGAVFALSPYPDSSLPNDFNEFLGLQVTSLNREAFYEELIDLADKKFGGDTLVNGVTVKQAKSDLFDFINLINNDGENLFLLNKI